MFCTLRRSDEHFKLICIVAVIVGSKLDFVQSFDNCSSFTGSFDVFTASWSVSSCSSVLLSGSVWRGSVSSYLYKCDWMVAVGWRQVSVARVAPNVPVVKCFNLWSGKSLSSCSARPPCFHWLTVSVFVSCPAAFPPSLCSWTDPPVWALPWQVNGSLTIHPERSAHSARSAPASEPAAGFIHCDVDVPLSPLLWSCECRSVQEQNTTKRTKRKPEPFLWFEPSGPLQFNEKRGDVICLLQQQTWQQACLSWESSCRTEN